jgi:hypothetical protein
MTESSITAPMPLSVGKVITQAWGLLLANFVILFLALLWYGLRSIILAAIALYFTVDSPNSPAFVVIAFTISFSLSYLEFGVLCLKLVRGERARPIMIPSFSIIVNWLIASILCSIAVVTGIILLVIPGIILSIRWCLYGFAAIDGCNALQSLKRSWVLARGAFWQIFAVSAVLTVPTFFIPNVLEIIRHMAMGLALAVIYNTRNSAAQVDKQ